MLKILSGICLSILILFGQENKAGAFDYYVLALSWENAFCEYKASQNDVPGECHSVKADDFDANNFILHGLWPNVRGDKKHRYGYCDVSKANFYRDKKGNWCELPMLTLSNTTRMEMYIKMPGSESCLHRHEWIKHGSCSGMDSEAYFRKSNFLVEGFSYTDFSEYIRQNIGKSVDPYVLYYKFEKEFGHDSSEYLALKCTRIKGKTYLKEIQIALNKSLENLNAYEDWLPKINIDMKKQGNCRGEVFIDAVGF